MENLEFAKYLTFRHGPLELSSDDRTPGQRRVDTLNALEGELKGYPCRKCKNKGYIAVLREDDSYFTRDCSCMPMRRCIRQMEQSGLSANIKELTFDSYHAKHPWQAVLKNRACEYAKNPKGWLMLAGQSGSGKTHLCTAVCRELLLRGESLLYMPWREYVGRLKALSMDARERAELLEKCKNAPWLYIDDLYKTGQNPETGDMPTAADINLAFEILNHRYCRRLPTILSSEKTPQELVAIDEATGSRIIEMCDEYVFSISRSSEKNYRLRSVTIL